MLDETLDTRLKIQEDMEEKILYVTILSDVKGIKYSEKWLEQQLVQQGYSWVSIPSSVHKSIEKHLKKNLPAKISLSPLTDAKVKVAVSVDLLSASLHISSAKGGEGVTTKDVIEALNDKKIDLDLVNKKRIVGLIAKSKTMAAGDSIDVVVAKGIPPKHGIDTRFECLVDNAIDRAPRVREDGTLDYYDLGEIPCLDEGCELMRKYPPEPAVLGKSVTGAELSARMAKTLHFKQHKGAMVSPTDSGLLISQIKGQPIISKRGVAIDNIYTVNNVDLRTGHIDYDGAIVVLGDVASGMKIKVTGDVQIYGMVENADIESDGNIDIKLGAIGRTNKKEIENLMKIRCKGDLTAGYLENVSGDIQGNIVVKSRISNCVLRAGEQFIVGNREQEKSGIVGGHIIAGSMIRSEVLGSTGCAITHIELAYKTDVLEQYEALKRLIIAKNELLMTKLSEMIMLSDKQDELTEEEKLLLEKLKEETEAIKTRSKELIQEQTEIEQALELAGAKKIIVKRETHPGVTVTIKDEELIVKSKCGAGEFFLVDGEIKNTAHK